MEIMDIKAQDIRKGDRLIGIGPVAGAPRIADGYVFIDIWHDGHGKTTRSKRSPRFWGTPIFTATREVDEIIEIERDAE